MMLTFNRHYFAAAWLTPYQNLRAWGEDVMEMSQSKVQSYASK